MMKKLNSQLQQEVQEVKNLNSQLVGQQAAISLMQWAEVVGLPLLAA